MVDCATEAGAGCNGGDSDLALDYVVKTGLVYERDYPYVHIEYYFRLPLMEYAKSIRERSSFQPDRITVSMKMPSKKELPITHYL